MSSDTSQSDSPIDRPRHIAIIMDGNGRWARARGLARSAGHRAGVEAARRTVEACARREIDVLSLFAFSSENWRRPRQEVSLLMELFVSALKREIKRLHENRVRVRFIGDRRAFAPGLQGEIEAAEDLTRDNAGLQLLIAANYGGRWDIAQAARRLVESARAGRLGPEDVTTESLAAGLTTAGLIEPDLFIRTGGEQRISNFLLWQLAYTELHFTERLWPDFEVDDLDRAIADYARRQRRFGRTGEQVESTRDA